jgi:Na+/glutamate symporter
MTKEDPAWLRQMIQQNDEKHEEAHHRMRTDHRALETDVRSLVLKVTALELAMTQQTMAVTALTNAPINIEKIVFNPKMVLAIVGLVASIVTGNWLTNQPIREQLVRSDERAKNMEDKIDNLQRQMEMRRLEIQQVSNDLQQVRRTK